MRTPVKALRDETKVNGQMGPSIPQAPPVALVVKRRRPVAYLAAAVALILACGLAAVWAVTSSGERTSVVGIATEVDWGQVIEEGDLAQVQVVQDVNLRTVAWSERGTLVGQRAATDLMPGSLLTPESVTGEPIPGPGQALVGVAVKSSQAPLQGFAPRDQVQLVVQPTASASTTGGMEPKVFTGTVVSTSKGDPSGARVVDVLVDESDSAEIAVAAAAGTVVLVAIPRG